MKSGAPGQGKQTVQQGRLPCIDKLLCDCNILRWARNSHTAFLISCYIICNLYGSARLSPTTVTKDGTRSTNKKFSHEIPTRGWILWDRNKMDGSFWTQCAPEVSTLFKTKEETTTLASATARRVTVEKIELLDMNLCCWLIVHGKRDLPNFWNFVPATANEAPNKLKAERAKKKDMFRLVCICRCRGCLLGNQDYVFSCNRICIYKVLALEQNSNVAWLYDIESRQNSLVRQAPTRIVNINRRVYSFTYQKHRWPTMNILHVQDLVRLAESQWQWVLPAATQIWLILGMLTQWQGIGQKSISLVYCRKAQTWLTSLGMTISNEPLGEWPAGVIWAVHGENQKAVWLARELRTILPKQQHALESGPS